MNPPKEQQKTEEAVVTEQAEESRMEETAQTAEETAQAVEETVQGAEQAEESRAEEAAQSAEEAARAVQETAQASEEAAQAADMSGELTDPAGEDTEPGSAENEPANEAGETEPEETVPEEEPEEKKKRHFWNRDKTKEEGIPEGSGEGRNSLEQNAYVQNGVSRLVFVILSIILEMIAIALVVLRWNGLAEMITITTRILAIFLVLGIYGKNTTSAMKVPWIILILAFPVLGVSLYLLAGNSGSTKKMRLRFAVVDTRLFPKMPQNNRLIEALQSKDRSVGNVASYIKSSSGFPLYQNTDVKYYNDASLGLEDQKEAIRNAKKFIFMEYHAIEDAEAFHELEEILLEKVAQGVEVRLFYDDMGSIGFINTDFIDRERARGIKCRVFNPFIPGMRLVMQNRDHRKITVVDGEVAFTGGYNIANEYFNLTHPYGHWKDTGIRLTGDAVRSLTVMFLEMWNGVREDDVDDRECDSYLPDLHYIPGEQGYVQPYADSPLDNERVGENVYVSMIERAQKYIWFMTPYLILTDEMIHAFGLAAKRGVDVRVITPGIPDKKLVYRVTRSYYHSLARCGVRVYEYTPGFLHAKQCVSDDSSAVCGTINLDYRSLYHHFENACMFYDCRAVGEMKADFENTFPQCREVTEVYRSGRSSFLRLTDLILRLAAPLL